MEQYPLTKQQRRMLKKGFKGYDRKEAIQHISTYTYGDWQKTRRRVFKKGKRRYYE